MGRVKGKIALVTGAARGVGKAIAGLLAKEGAQVLVTDVLDRQGKRTADEIGESARFMHLDVSHEEAWENATRFLESEYERLDILVNNAAIMGVGEEWGPQDPERCSLATWHAIHRVNLDGVFLGCKWGIHMMKSHGGSIVNISSRTGVVGLPVACAYASSKAGVCNHTKTVALYCAEKGYPIRCNSVHPSAIRTAMWDPFFEGREEAERQHELSRHIPLQRFGRPEEVARLALFLASDESSYITGAEHRIDGGIMAGTVSLPR